MQLAFIHVVLWGLAFSYAHVDFTDLACSHEVFLGLAFSNVVILGLALVM